MLDEEVVLKARRAVRSGKKTTLQLRAELSLTQSAVHNLLTGKTYSNVPEALTRTRGATISDEKVISIRKRYREHGGHLAALGRKYGMSGRNFESLLLGKGSFSKIPNPLSEKHISLPIALGKKTVLDLRQRYEEAKGRITLQSLAAEYKTTLTTIKKALRGDAPYDRYKGFEAAEVLNNAAYLRVKEVQEMRHYYRVNLGKVSLPDLAEKYNTPAQMVRKALLGRGPYAKIPNPVEAIISASNRKLEPEVVLFMRFVYLSGNVTQKQMAEAYGLSQGYMHQILSGICYGHVPEAICAKDRMGKPRRLSTEQVVWARRMYRTGQITMRAIQKEIGIETQAMGAMLRGFTYKEIPGAVPERIKFRRRGMVTKPRAFLHWEPHEIPLAKAAIEEAVSRAGSPMELAKALGMDCARRVHDWRRQGFVAGPRVGEFSRVTGIEPARLRPDLCRDQESGLHIAIVDPENAAEMERLMPGGHRIMNEIAAEYEVTIEALLESTGKKEPYIQDARLHMWCRIKVELGYSARKIAVLCNRDPKTIENQIKRALEVETPSTGIVRPVDGNRPLPLVINGGCEL